MASHPQTYLPESHITETDSNLYFPDSETYDGLTDTNEMAADSIIPEDNPLYLGGLEIVRTDAGSYMVGGSEFNIENAQNSSYFEREYGNADYKTAAWYIMKYYYTDRNAIGHNGDPSNYTWWARVKNKTQHNTFSVSLIWSNEVNSIQPLLDEYQ